MALTPRLVNEIIRQKLGVKDDSMAAAIMLQVPEALKATARKIAADPSLRALLQTEKSTTSIALTTGGKCDLNTLYSTYFAIKEFLNLGQMYYLPAITVTAVFAVGDLLTIATYLSLVSDLARVQFTTTGTLPSGISAATNYYVINYSSTTGGFQLSDVADGSGLVNIGSAGTGTLTMTLMDADGYPIQLRPSPQVAALPNYLGSVFQYGYIQADVLYLQPSTTAGSVAFAVPYYPTSLSELPADEMTERMFIEKLYELVLPAVNDAAQDGPK